MKLERLYLENFRCFVQLDLDFHPSLTVISAKNGQGKTALLEAATIVLSTFVGAFDLGKPKRIEVKDVRYTRIPERVASEQVFPVRLKAMCSPCKQMIVRELTGDFCMG